MHGITIFYDYDGEEAAWEQATSNFIAAIDQDPELAGRLHYRVNRAREGGRRVHWGWWDDPEIVPILQSRDYFKEFTARVREMAGRTLTTIPLTRRGQTAA